MKQKRRKKNRLPVEHPYPMLPEEYFIPMPEEPVRDVTTKFKSLPLWSDKT